MFFFVEILNDFDHVIGIKFRNRLGNNIRAKAADDLFTQFVIKLGQKFRVKVRPDQINKLFTLIAAGPPQKVGNIGKVKFGNKFGRARMIIFAKRIKDFTPIFRCQINIVVAAGCAIRRTVEFFDVTCHLPLLMCVLLLRPAT